MSTPLHLAAIDLGADSGRVALATWDGRRMALEVLHRFPNGARERGGYLRWDYAALMAGIHAGLAMAAQRTGGLVAGLGVDTWGVDYGLVDGAGTLIEEPIAYRDARTEAAIPRVHGVLGGPVAAFARTGLQPMPYNTVFQLDAHRQAAPEALHGAARLLLTPELISHQLGGEPWHEWSIASTTGLCQPGRMAWDGDVIAALDLPGHLFGHIVPAGTASGWMKPELVARLGFVQAPRIILTGCHDTASAVAALPVPPTGTAFLSCGTWSLLGVILDAPRTTEAAFAAGLGNEVTADGRTRLLRSIMGLWVAQECRRDRQAEGLVAVWGDLAAAAESAPPASAAIPIDDQCFFPPSRPGDRMVDRVRAACAALDLPCADDGALFRRLFEALAAAYARGLEAIATVTGERPRRLAMVGGGCRNRLLCRLTAERTGLPVMAGPEEGTALGNALIQARALGWITADRFPEVVAASCDVHRYGATDCG